MRHLVLGLPLAVTLAACGGPGDEADTPAEMGDHAMPAMEDVTPVVASEVTTIDVRTTWMRPHPQGRDVTAAYLTVYLESGREDLLVSARIDGAERVEMHSHSMTADGMMQMRAIGPQHLASEGPLVFVPGARHLMVFGLPPVVEGDTVNGTLVFQNAGEIPVVFEVRNAPPGVQSDY